jgi:hypothetical protein
LNELADAIGLRLGLWQGSEFDLHPVQLVKVVPEVKGVIPRPLA